MIMGFLPDDFGDAFWFALSPVTTVPVSLYAAAAYVTDDYRYGRPDWKSNLRNASIWAAIYFGNVAYHAYMHPGKYAPKSGSGAYKLLGHHLANPAVILPAVAVASAAGWIATADEHGAVAPGVASGFGMPVTPELYSGATSSDPLALGSQSFWEFLNPFD